MYCTPVLSHFPQPSLSSSESDLAIEDKSSKEVTVQNGNLPRRNGSAERSSKVEIFVLDSVPSAVKEDSDKLQPADSVASLEVNSDTSHTISEIDDSNLMDSSTSDEEVTASTPKSLNGQEDKVVGSLMTHEFHESLHKKMSVSAKNPTSASVPIDIPPNASAIQKARQSNATSGNGHIPGCRYEPHECSDEHFSQTPQAHPPAANIEMRSIRNKSPTGNQRFYVDGKIVSGMLQEDGTTTV